MQEGCDGVSHPLLSIERGCRMGNTEDYLDSLLNSINSSNMSGRTSRSDDPRDNASEAFRRFEREQEYKREQRRKKAEEQRRESEFLKEFEGELSESDIEADEFLHQFELELEAEKGDDLDRGEVDDTDFFGNIEGIVSDVSKDSEPKEPEPISKEPVLQEMVSNENQPEPEESLLEEEPLMDSLFIEEDGEPEKSKEPEYVTEELMEEGDNGEADLLDLLSGMQEDGELAEIGDLLKADEQNIELEEAAMELEKASESVRQETSFSTEEPAEQKADKKSKGKKGFFAKIAAALFGNDEEEEAIEDIVVPESEDLESISDENLQILRELEAAEQANAGSAEKGKKEKKKKKKKEKKEKEPKEKKERKKRPKKEKPPKEPDNTPPLPKKPVMLIFLMAFSILLLVLLTIKGTGRTVYLDEAKLAMENGEYVEAYSQLSGLELKKSEQSLYEKAECMALVQEQYDAYVTMMGANKYELALDALIRGIGRCEDSADTAAKYGLENELSNIKSQLTEALDNQFGMTEKDAKKLYSIKDRDEYSVKIGQKIAKMNLRQVEQ